FHFWESSPSQGRARRPASPSSRQRPVFTFRRVRSTVTCHCWKFSPLQGCARSPAPLASRHLLVARLRKMLMAVSLVPLPSSTSCAVAVVGSPTASSAAEVRTGVSGNVRLRMTLLYATDLDRTVTMTDLDLARVSGQGAGSQFWFADFSGAGSRRSEEHTSEFQSHENIVCRHMPDKKNIYISRCE